MEQLQQLYKQYTGKEPATCQPITGSGSNRDYYRLSDDEGHSVIGVIGTSRDENHAFIYLAHHFTRRQLPVPEVLAVSDDGLRYLQTDLGQTSLFDALRKGREAEGTRITPPNHRSIA